MGEGVSGRRFKGRGVRVYLGADLGRGGGGEGVSGGRSKGRGVRDADLGHK